MTAGREHMSGGVGTRRDFLRQSGAAVMGAAAVSLARPARADDGARRIRMGVVGGRFGASFYWHTHPRSEVVAVSDLIPERLERLKNVYQCDKGYPSLEELILDPDVEAVAIFTGAPDHVRHSVAALRAGKHVVCAVPAGCTVEECEELLDTVKETGLTYMMAETSYYRQAMISARKWHAEDRFGVIHYSESEYHHDGLENLFVENGERTWRYGYPPMLYPTHNLAFIVGLTGERLTEVTCVGWGDDAPYLQDNDYGNPFWNETAFFQTDAGHGHRAAIYWRGAHRGTERAQWYGTKMSFHMATPHGHGPVIVRRAGQTELDDGGFERDLPELETYEQTPWWSTDMLPGPLRHETGHGNSHTFLTHEFIQALLEERRPAIDAVESLAYTVPGIIAHASSRKDGERLTIPQYAW